VLPRPYVSKATRIWPPCPSRPTVRHQPPVVLWSVSTSAAAANCSCDRALPRLVGGKAAGEVEPEDLSGNLIVVLP
jgi:hypothetical protein